MKTQRRSLTVRIIRANVTEDALGNETTAPGSLTIHGCQFDPIPADERTSTDQVTVLRTGILNMPGCHRLGSDDTVEFHGSTWQVIGGSDIWRDRTKLRVQQPRTR